MDGWLLVTWSSVCAGGVLMFLGAVASEIASVEDAMDVFEIQQARAHHQAKQAAASGQAGYAESATETTPGIIRGTGG